MSGTEEPTGRKYTGHYHGNHRTALGPHRHQASADGGANVQLLGGDFNQSDDAIISQAAAHASTPTHKVESRTVRDVVDWVRSSSLNEAQFASNGSPEAAAARDAMARMAARDLIHGMKDGTVKTGDALGVSKLGVTGEQKVAMIKSAKPVV
jgi:hypothetical protein